MAVFRYVVADVFTDTPLAGNQLAVFTDARGSRPADDAGAGEGDGLLRDRVRAAARDARRRRPDPDLHAGARAAVRRPPDARRRHSCSAGRCRRWCSGSRPTPASCRSSSSARGRGSCSAGWSSRSRRGRRSTTPTAMLAALGVERSGLPVERYHLGPSHVYVELDSPAGRRRCAPDFAALGRRPTDGVNCFARDGDRWKTRMFAPAPRRPRGSGHRLGRRPARGPPRPPRPHRVRRGDRDLAGRRDRPAVDALRARRRERRTGSSACGSAARR